MLNPLPHLARDLAATFGQAGCQIGSCAIPVPWFWMREKEGQGTSALAPDNKAPRHGIKRLLRKFILKAVKIWKLKKFV